MTVSGATHANFEVTWTQRPENVTEKWTGWVPADAVAIQGSTLSVTVASGVILFKVFVICGEMFLQRRARLLDSMDSSCMTTLACPQESL